MATLEQIALRAGVSSVTVANVLSGRTKGSYPSALARAQRIRAIAEELNYQPSAAARVMRSRQTMQIGAVYLNAPDRTSAAPHNHYLIAGVNAGLEQAGYVLCVVRATDVTAPAEALESRVFREKILDGVVVLNAISPDVERRIEQLVPAVVWADTNHFHTHNCVRRDEFDAGSTAAEALIQGGARRIFWVGPAPVLTAEGDHYSFTHRREGAKRAVEAAGMQWNEIRTEPHWTPDGHRALKPLLSPAHPADRVGLITYDGIYRVAQVVHVAMLERRKVGVDFSLVACDDTPMTIDHFPQLTRVEFDRFALGKRTASMMLRRLEGNDGSCPSELHRDRLVAGTTATLLPPGDPGPTY